MAKENIPSWAKGLIAIGLTAGRVLNKTDIDVYGFAASPTIETMRVELTIVKIYI
jgi:hypothetical protein